MFDLSLDDAQQMVVDTARQFAARVLAPRAASLDIEGGFPRESLREAAPDDVVLIAGKGHEDYQEASGARTPFSDAGIARDALAAWSATS